MPPAPSLKRTRCPQPWDSSHETVVIIGPGIVCAPDPKIESMTRPVPARPETTAPSAQPETDSPSVSQSLTGANRETDQDDEKDDPKQVDGETQQGEKQSERRRQTENGQPARHLFRVWTGGSPVLNWPVRPDPFISLRTIGCCTAGGRRTLNDRAATPAFQADHYSYRQILYRPRYFRRRTGCFWQKISASGRSGAPRRS